MSTGTQQRIARNALVRSGGEIVAKVASLLFFVTMARQLGPDGYGAFMFALGLTTALLVGAGFGTDELTAREVARDHTRGGRYLSDVATLKTVTAVGLIALGVLIAQLGPFSRDARAAVLILGIGVAVEAIARTWYMIFQANERLELISLSIVLQRTLTAVIGIVVLLLGGGVIAASLVYTVGALAGLAVSELSVRRLVPHRPRPQPRTWLPLLRTAFPIGVAFLLYVLLMRLDVTLLSFISGEKEVGVYAAAYRLVESTQFVAWAMSAAMMPWLSRTAAGGLQRGYELGLAAMNAVLLPISLIFTLFAPGIVHLLYGHAFDAAVLPLQLLGLTSALYGMQSYASTSLIARDAPTTFGKLVAVVVVLNLGANLVVIPKYGADGAAAVSLASGLLLGAASVWLAGRRVGGVRFWRSFAAPVLASVAMTLSALAVPSPLIPAAVLSLVVYALALLGAQRLLFPDDYDVFVGLVPRRLSAWSASRSRSGRRSA
jgi:O-antigen/teichoic acid export membrane protein